jgi:glycosyltransferase involved in cell wall biosynthesis
MHAHTPPLHIAVVIPCYNSQAWIDSAIRSVLDQEYVSLKLIVVDDGSTDASTEHVRAYGARVSLQTGPNRGACHARNMGLKMAKDQGAEYVLFLDADDYLEGDMIAGAAQVAADTSADIVLSEMHLLYPDGSRKERFIFSGRVHPEEFFEGWMRGNYFNPSAVLWRISFVEKIGGWDESLSRAQDMDISLRAMFEAPLIMKNSRGAAIHARVNPSSISQNVSRKATESRMNVTIGLLRKAQGTSFEPFLELLNRELYSIARTAFKTGQTDLGRRGMEELSAQGYREHPGNRSHRLVARMIGLEAKVRLWGG